MQLTWEDGWLLRHPWPLSLCVSFWMLSRPGILRGGGSSALHASPMLIIDQGIDVISVHSSDSDPDSANERCMSDSPIEMK